MASIEKIAEGRFLNDDMRRITIKPADISRGWYYLDYWRKCVITGKSVLGYHEYDDIADTFVGEAKKQGRWVGMNLQYLHQHYFSETFNALVEDQNHPASQPTHSGGGMPHQQQRVSFYPTPPAVIDPQKIFEQIDERTRQSLACGNVPNRFPQEGYHSCPTLIRALYCESASSRNQVVQILENFLRAMVDLGHLSRQENIFFPTQGLVEAVYRVSRDPKKYF